MASLKSLLQIAMLKMGSNGAQAGSEVIQLFSQETFSSNVTKAFVPPCDGYIYIRAGAGTGKGYVSCSNGAPATSSEGASVQSNTDGDSARALVYVKRGRQIVYGFIVRSGTLLYGTVTFIKSVGGSL